MRPPIVPLLAILAVECGEGIRPLAVPTCAGASAEQLSNGVKKLTCTADVTVVTIDRNRADLELWVLEEPLSIVPTNTDDFLHGARLDDGHFREHSQAIVQMNGFTFDCEGGGDACYSQDIDELPTTRVYESTHVIRSISTVGADWMLSFGSKSASGPRIHLTANGGEEPRYRYNAVGSTFDLVNDGVCSTSSRLDAWTVIGYKNGNPGQVVMLFSDGWSGIPGLGWGAWGNTAAELCTFLQNEFGITHAMRMDGGGSAGMDLKKSDGTHDTIGNVDRRIPYRIGLVSLDDNIIKNGDLEQPALPNSQSGTPAGRHPFVGEQVVPLEWEGAIDLYNTTLYNPWIGRKEPEMVLPAGRSQLAMLRPRDVSTDHLQQPLAGAPPNRYCMLHFWHGYAPHQASCPGESELRVEFLGSTTPTSTFTSVPTMGPNAALKEAWLRFLTPPAGTVTLKFTASHPTAPGNCGVLLDNVSVECVQ